MNEENPTEEDIDMLMDVAGFVSFNDDVSLLYSSISDYNKAVGEAMKIESKLDEMNFEIEYLRDMYGIAMRDLALAEDGISMMRIRIDELLNYLKQDNYDISSVVSELKSMSMWNLR